MITTIPSGQCIYIQLCYACWYLLFSLLQPGSIMAARWPVAEEVNETLLREADYLLAVSHEFRVRLKKMMDLREKVCPSVSTIYIYSGTSNPDTDGTEGVSCLVRCPFSEVEMHATVVLGLEIVYCLERCHQFKGVLIGCTFSHDRPYF